MTYIEKCIRNYLNDNFTMAEALYMFSHFIAYGMAWTLTNEIKQTAEDFISEGWIDPTGKILIKPDEADSLIYYKDKKFNNGRFQPPPHKGKIWNISC